MRHAWLMESGMSPYGNDSVRAQSRLKVVELVLSRYWRADIGVLRVSAAISRKPHQHPEGQMSGAWNSRFQLQPDTKAGGKLSNGFKCQC